MLHVPLFSIVQSISYSYILYTSFLRELFLLPGYNHNYKNNFPANYLRNNLVDHGIATESVGARASALDRALSHGCVPPHVIKVLGFYRMRQRSREGVIRRSSRPEQCFWRVCLRVRPPGIEWKVSKSKNGKQWPKNRKWPSARNGGKMAQKWRKKRK